MKCGWCPHDICHPYIISSTLYIFYYVQLSFHTLSTQMHIVHVICMLSAHVHVICLSSLMLHVYPIIHNLVSVHCLHCQCDLYIVYKCICYIHLISTTPVRSPGPLDNVNLICICPDSMQMTCTYTDNSSRDDMYITYAFLNSIQMTLTICICVDNVWKLSCG